MQQVRPTPFDLVFEPLAQTTFPRIQSALTESGQDPLDRDAFLMLRDVVTLLRELRPEEGLGEGIDQLAALIHHGYLFWHAGKRSIDLSTGQLSEILRETPQSAEEEPAPPPHYVQVPVRRLWAPVVPGEAPEPLDGFFQFMARPSLLRVLAVFGIHPERPGFSVVEVAGPRPKGLARPDSSPLFAPTLEGGSAAGIYSLAGGEELLELGWRVHKLGVGSWEPEAVRSGRSGPGS
ncbi:MAG TPA: hypothetical protein VE399_08385 [Gemmatimonadales bacterium]|jgi:hypothetical protein|nr:hypothetical protein [Gemmatimonadales bacterium]